MITFTYNNIEIQGTSGQSIAAALIANHERITRYTRIGSKPRGLFCGIGICFDCLLIIDNQRNQRSCIVEVKEGMSVMTQHDH